MFSQQGQNRLRYRNLHVSRNAKLLNDGHEALSLLVLQLENLPSFKVAAAECGARDDISGEGLKLRLHIQLAGAVRTKGLRPSADKLFAARRKCRQHEL